MGVLYYLALVVGSFGGCWVLVGESIARWIFVTIHVGCTTAVILLYMKELTTPCLAESQNIGTSSSSQKLHS